ncbi:MAG: nucleoside triphosphate pyrophosphohydrolase [Thermodesulfovibrionaceae bacterium]
MEDKFQKLLNIMEKLRSEKGCPWDRIQTHDTLKRYLVEETYELIEAIDKKDSEAIKEELGDLLLQIVFHTQIAKEEGRFRIDDVIDTISNKLIARHPHVFGDANFNTPEDVLRQWEDRKKEEGKLKDSLLEGIPKGLPALLRAYKIQSRVSKVGFDWKAPEDVISKLEEEIKELKEAIKINNKEKIEGEIGDLLFSVVNLCRLLKIDPESCLRKTNLKFEKRFREMERLATLKNKSLEEMSLEEMDSLWDEIKKKE